MASNKESAETGKSADTNVSAEIGGLVRDHYEELYRYGYRLAGKQADAEDLVQQTFLIAQQKLGQVREASCRRSWLFTVLRNHFLKTGHKQQRIVAGSSEIDFDELPDDVPDELSIDTEALQAALDELPEEYRVVVVMYYFEDCSYKEIASQLEIAIGTVMSRLWRAKKYLRSQLTLRSNEQQEGQAQEFAAPLPTNQTTAPHG